MTMIDTLFDRMDDWRHLPNYQLERRADLFFALYLAEALQAKLGIAMRPELVPEFPIRIGTIYLGIPTNKSVKADYLALSAAGDRAILVELKTEGLSRRTEQDDYLKAAQQIGLLHLLEGLLDIFRATNFKRKYYCLLELLERLGLLRIPTLVKDIIMRPSLVGVVEASREIEITRTPVETTVVYVQPNGTGANVISFHDFAQVVAKHKDALSLRFAASLRQWADVLVGE